MDGKIFLLMSCVVVASCNSNISDTNDATQEYELSEDIMSEIGSIRQLQQEMKSDIEEIREIVIQLQNQAISALCPRGFTYLPSTGSCYKAIYERHNWTSAANKCKEFGRASHLVAIRSAEENHAVKTFLASELSKNVSSTACVLSGWSHLGNWFWTSGQRQNENNCRSRFVWKLSCDEELPFQFTSWVPGEPNCRDNQEFCVHIWPKNNFTWNDESCNSQICPLCEYTP